MPSFGQAFKPAKGIPPTLRMSNGSLGALTACHHLVSGRLVIDPASGGPAAIIDDPAASIPLIGAFALTKCPWFWMRVFRFT